MLNNNCSSSINWNSSSIQYTTVSVTTDFHKHPRLCFLWSLNESVIWMILPPMLAQLMQTPAHPAIPQCKQSLQSGLSKTPFCTCNANCMLARRHIQMALYTLDSCCASFSEATLPGDRALTFWITLYYQRCLGYKVYSMNMLPLGRCQYSCPDSTVTWDGHPEGARGLPTKILGWTKLFKNSKTAGVVNMIQHD